MASHYCLLNAQHTGHRFVTVHTFFFSFILIYEHTRRFRKDWRSAVLWYWTASFDKFETSFHGVQKVCLVSFLSPLANTQINLWGLSATSLISTRPLPTTNLSTGKHGWESCQQLHSHQPPKRTTLLHLQVRKTLQTQACYSTYFLCLENNGSIIT